jgi:hypothetical protein
VNIAARALRMSPLQWSGKEGGDKAKRGVALKPEAVLITFCSKSHCFAKVFGGGEGAPGGRGGVSEVSYSKRDPSIVLCCHSHTVAPRLHVRNDRCTTSVTAVAETKHETAIWALTPTAAKATSGRWCIIAIAIETWRRRDWLVVQLVALSHGCCDN